ncbi:type IV pilus assembly protein PilV [Modicisalibacter ilicicola DSM 19980]|uniref:Type IV pilus assembly protein PilV n=1 Tax=Modicisalibacter ilicicola DSM 19980 TaxID=1121942 RepID=A0A1M5DDM8_9GAMM|nr:prepilin-type N-terminal cleavage/methylation domain-containing protein [Halomonas ilicicola]SHF65026.1 type IV pilus assembly protein PilV [Halomonas ilicicola DSM 19980]
MRQTGVSLIESLIALLLISIALLGVAGLQLTSLQDARDARWRVEAISLANGMLELMRTDADEAAAFTLPLDAASPACGPSEPGACLRDAWLADVAQTLPNAVATVSVAQVNDVDRVAISLRWRQQPPDAANPLPACGADAASGGCVMLDTRL